MTTRTPTQDDQNAAAPNMTDDLCTYPAKTCDLKDHALDWAVAKAAGVRVHVGFRQVLYTPPGKRTLHRYSPSTNWKQGGPIIERERIRLDTTWRQEDGHWSARIDKVGGWWQGSTPLIAAMRCFVASRLGDTVSYPAH